MAMALHPDLTSLEGLVGTWRGEGRGHYPTISDFTYGEEVIFEVTPKPYLAYRSRTWLLPENTPAHAEVGYWRCPGGGSSVEVVLTHPFGIVEVQEGTFDGSAFALKATSLGATTTAKDVTAVERRFMLDGDRLSYDVAMAAVGQPLTAHLTAELRRVG